MILDFARSIPGELTLHKYLTSDELQLPDERWQIFLENCEVSEYRRELKYQLLLRRAAKLVVTCNIVSLDSRCPS
jgi:hypothetical protein